MSTETFNQLGPAWSATCSSVSHQATGTASMAFGSTEVRAPSGTHRWFVKYEKNGDLDRCCEYIGIASDASNVNKAGQNITSITSSVCLTVNGKGQTCCHSVNLNGSNTNKKLEKVQLQPDDVILITLDMIQKEVRFSKNDELLFTQNNLAASSYRLAVSADKGAKFTVMEHTMPDIALAEIISRMSTMRQSVISFGDDQIPKASLEQLAEFKQRAASFMDETKEFEQEYEMLKKAVQRVNEKAEQAMNPNTANYQQWDAEQMIRFVAWLENGRFAKYAEMLRAEFVKQGISTGADLTEIEANDLHTMGMMNLKDRKALVKHFEALDTKQSK